MRLLGLVRLLQIDVLILLMALQAYWRIDFGASAAAAVAMIYLGFGFLFCTLYARSLGLDIIMEYPD